MLTGFWKALELGAKIVVKVDGDGQMDMEYLPGLLIPLIEARADYTKGNRFRDFQALQKMPLLFFGFIFGTTGWLYYAMRDIPAPTGTVIIPTLSVLLGVQFVIAAIEIDLRSIPTEPLSTPL